MMIIQPLRPVHPRNLRDSLTDECAYDLNTVQILNNPNSKVRGVNMGPIWGRQDPGGTHVGPMNFAILEVSWK